MPFLLISFLQNKEAPKLTLADAARFITDAWAMVSADTIRHCWLHSGLVPENHKAKLQAMDSQTDIQFTTSLEDLQQDIQQGIAK